MNTDPSLAIRFGYTNHRGVYAIRTVVPESIFYGTTPEHSTPQWLMKAYCLDRNALRTFALEGLDFHPDEDDGK